MNPWARWRGIVFRSIRWACVQLFVQRQVAAEAHMAVVEGKVDGIAKDMNEIVVTLRERSTDFVTAQDFRVWRRQFAKDNPTIPIPEWIK